MKKIFYMLLAALAFHAERLLASAAEGGPQSPLPAFRSNSNYSALGPTRYVIVAANGTLRAQLATDPGSSTILGVMQNNPGIDEAMSVAQAGLSKVVAGGSISANVIFTTNASGRATAVRSGDIAVGRTLEAAGNDGDVITAMLFHPVRWFGVP